MKLKKDLVLRKIENDYLIVDPNQDMVNLSQVYTLNETAAYLWQQLQNREFEVDDLVELLLERYEVEESLARRDAERFLEVFRQHGVIGS